MDIMDDEYHSTIFHQQQDFGVCLKILVSHMNEEKQHVPLIRHLFFGSRFSWNPRNAAAMETHLSVESGEWNNHLYILGIPKNHGLIHGEYLGFEHR